MNKHLLSLAASGALLLITTPNASAVVEYVRICSIYGAGFHYIPGTDVCVNETNGDTRQQTEAGTWRSLTPYPEGEWVAFPKEACPNGRVVTLGTFSAKDFTLNPWGRMQTAAVSVLARRGDYVSKVIMSGGFLDPRTPHRNAVNTSSGLCVRSTDPNAMQDYGSGPYNPPFGNGMLPIGCIANSRILGMPAAYSVSATAAYPEIDSGYADPDQNVVAGPYTYGSKLVVTTDFGGPTFQQLTYYDARSASYVPLAGSVTVAVCVR